MQGRNRAGAPEPDSSRVFPCMAAPPIAVLPGFLRIDRYGSYPVIIVCCSLGVPGLLDIVLVDNEHFFDVLFGFVGLTDHTSQGLFDVFIVCEG